MRSVDKGMVQGNFSTIMKIQQTLEREGISFIADPGDIAIGKTRAGRFSFVVFTLRVANDQLKLRPISARFMHKKEIAKYEKEIARLQNR